jgi:hypothetical protein
MRSTRLSLCLVSCVALACLASPAVACLNDRETKGREREFKSQYQQESPPTSPAPQENAPDVQNIAMAYPRTYVALGGTMAIAGLTLGFAAWRRKA